MQLLAGDRFTDEEGQWEVIGHPFTTREGKVVHVSVQKPGESASAREKTWGAHERLMVQRESAMSTPKPQRPSSKRAKKR